MKILWVLGLLSGSALAAPTAAEILSNVDRGLNAFKDGTFDSKLLVHDGGSAREYGFTTFQKGSEKRLVRFNSPGDVRGMGVLLENKETMYVFLPGFQRIRRMGMHAKNQNFMGSDFSYDDIAQTAFSPSYTAELAPEEPSSYVLELKVKPKIETDFPRMKMWVDKSNWSPTKMEYYDASGKKVKTQVRDGYHQDGPGHFQPTRVVVTDHRRGDHVSEIVFTGSKIDSGLGDDLFTQRALLR